MAVATRPVEPLTTPFKFLEYYEERDAERFAGRERDVAAIVDATTVARTLVLYGKSGLGKTSLLLAGVFPELRSRGLTPVYLRTLRDPLGDVRDEMAARLPPEARSGSLLELLRTRARSEPLVLVLDQFEEFFIRFRDQRDTYDGFVDVVGEIVRDQSLPVHVLFSLREEYLADLDDFRARVPALFENEYRLRPMSAFGVREAITRPLHVAKIPFDTRLVSRLVDELSAKRFDSVMLQILCQEVFDQAIKRDPYSVRLTSEDLERVGNIDAIFRRYLDEMSRSVASGEQLQTRVVLQALMTQERTKQAMRLADFSRTVYRLSDTEVTGALESLLSHRLVREDRRGNEKWYELTHERIVPILDGWLRLDREFNAMSAAHDLVVTTARSDVWRDTHESLLSSGFLSDLLGPYRSRLILSGREIELAFRSAAYRRHPAVAFWAEKHGLEASRALVLDQLGTSDAAVRQGAAFSAGTIFSAGPERRALLRVALHDEVAAVRREAARSFYHTGAGQLDSSLLDALRRRETRKNAIGALADMRIAGDSLRGFPLWARWCAAHLARRALRRENGVFIGDAGAAALRGGLWGALAWTLLVAAPYWALVGGQVPGRFWLIFTSALLISGLVSAVFALLIGFFAGTSLALTSLVLKSTNWGRAVYRSAGYRGVLACWLLGWTAFAIISGEWTDSEFVAIVVVPPLYWLTIPILVHLTRPGSAAHRRSVGWLAGNAAAVAAGLPLLVPGLAFELADRPFYDSDLSDAFAVLSLVSAPFLSAVTAVLVAGFGRAATIVDAGGGATSRRANVVRSLLMAGTLPLCVLAVTLFELGPESLLPLQRARDTLSASNPSSLDLVAIFTRTSHLSRVKYRRFRVEGTSYRWVTVEATSWVYRTYLDGDFFGCETPCRVLLAPGDHVLAFKDDEAGTIEIELKAESALALAEPDVVAVPPTPSADQPSPSLARTYFWIFWTRVSGKEHTFKAEVRTTGGARVLISPGWSPARLADGASRRMVQRVGPLRCFAEQPRWLLEPSGTDAVIVEEEPDASGKLSLERSFVLRDIAREVESCWTLGYVSRADDQ